MSHINIIKLLKEILKSKCIIVKSVVTKINRNIKLIVKEQC